MDSSLFALLELGAAITGQSLLEIERLALAMLVDTQTSMHSTLNNDGSPLQLSVSLGMAGKDPAVRLLVDPASEPSSSVNQRIHRIEQALASTIELRAPEMRSLCDSVLMHMLPTEISVRSSLPSGGAWLAADLSRQGVALYATTKWGETEQRWSRTRRWLSHFMSQETISIALTPIEAHASLISAGIEGVSPNQARVKLYWRLNDAASLKDIDLPLLNTNEMVDFLTYVIEDRRIHRGTVVGSVSFNLTDGTLSDVKLDVCGHCVPRSWAGWLPILHRCITRFNLTEWPSIAPEMLERTELAFIGFGLDQFLKPRLNVYIKRLST